MLSSEFLIDFKKKTEAAWAAKRLNPSLYGFQIVPGTRWLPGLSDIEIQAYQKDIGLTFPPDFSLFLRHMNGTDRGTLNIYGSCGEKHRSDVGVYSYPRDLNRIRSLMDEWSLDWPEISSVYQLGPKDRCVPIYGHRGILCRMGMEVCHVFSIMGDDAVLYDDDLGSYLKREFLDPPLYGTP